METACLFPGKVASLALIATTSAFGGRDDSFKDAFIAARLKPLDNGVSLRDLAKEFVPQITGSGAVPDAVSAAISTMEAVPPDTYRDIIRCLVTFDRRADIAGLTLPVCLISGAQDQNAPPKTMARMAERFPNARYAEIPDVGHLVNLEAPQQTNAILSDFYESLT